VPAVAQEAVVGPVREERSGTAFRHGEPPHRAERKDEDG
jgi:hypothetical protein